MQGESRLIAEDPGARRPARRTRGDARGAYGERRTKRAVVVAWRQATRGAPCALGSGASSGGHLPALIVGIAPPDDDILAAAISDPRAMMHQLHQLRQRHVAEGASARGLQWRREEWDGARAEALNMFLKWMFSSTTLTVSDSGSLLQSRILKARHRSGRLRADDMSALAHVVVVIPQRAWDSRREARSDKTFAGFRSLPGRHGSCLSCVTFRAVRHDPQSAGDHRVHQRRSNKESNMSKYRRGSHCWVLSARTVCRQRDGQPIQRIPPWRETPGYRDRRKCRGRLAVDGQERICVLDASGKLHVRVRDLILPATGDAGPVTDCQRQLGLRRQRGHRASETAPVALFDEGERQPSWANWRAFPLFAPISWSTLRPPMGSIPQPGPWIAATGGMNTSSPLGDPSGTPHTSDGWLRVLLLRPPSLVLALGSCAHGPP